MKKAAIVTGASQGLGKAFATRLAQEGYQVMVADVDQAAGDALVAKLKAAGHKAAYYQCDVTIKEQVVAMVQSAIDLFGGIHVLVNNAVPPARMSAIEDKSDDEIHRQLDGALFAARWAMNTAFPAMKAQQYGRVINLCSLNGVNAHPMTADYNIAKEALRALTRSAAREWAPYGITVNAICPGAVTKAYENMVKMAPQMAERVKKQVPMGYMGDPYRDVSGVVLFLASDDAGYMTGNTLFVDGGGHINGINWASLFD
jgi:NAD(P)-dependent dehydrogenase (short-subunit alcohol dehydrogenase family)